MMTRRSGRAVGGQSFVEGLRESKVRVACWVCVCVRIVLGGEH